TVNTPGREWHLSGEFLYLWPNRDGLGNAVVITTQNGMSFSSLESLSWDGTAAFRLAARYSPCGSDVDFGASFMYFHPKAQRTVDASDGGLLVGTLAPDPRAHDAAESDGDAGVGYAVLDLDAGKVLCCSETFNLRCFAGIRLASINQTLKSIYSEGALGDVSD